MPAKKNVTKERLILCINATLQKKAKEIERNRGKSGGRKQRDRKQRDAVNLLTYALPTLQMIGWFNCPSIEPAGQVIYEHAFFKSR